MWMDLETAISDHFDSTIHSGLVPPPPNWEMEYTQLKPSPNQGECRDILFPGLFLRSAKIQTTLSMSGCGDCERHIFVFLSNMKGEGRLNGNPLPEGLTAVCGTQPFEAILPPTDMLGITINRGMMNEYLEDVEGLIAPDWMGNGIYTLGVRESTSRATKMFKAHFEDASPLADADGIKSAIFSMLGIILSNSDSDPEVVYSWQNRIQIVRRVREYIIDRISEPIKIGEICRQIGVSRRALQYIFQDVLGVNPVAFLRILRLNRARRDLFDNENTFQVKDVIDRWGFWHPSRFSGEYRQMFEELPSETLRRCRFIG